VGEFVNSGRVSSITRSSSFTINNSLDGEGLLRPSVLSDDVESISNTGNSGLSPTRSTIFGDMLINRPRHIIDSVYISPIPSGG